ncbi:hypothetical protein LDENG_00291720 [Lucifuga dentata]|nr:hypothetical protein LDENG_00291720 [Lucifuga dentata]
MRVCTGLARNRRSGPHLPGEEEAHSERQANVSSAAIQFCHFDLVTVFGHQIAPLHPFSFVFRRSRTLSAHHQSVFSCVAVF